MLNSFQAPAHFCSLTWVPNQVSIGKHKLNPRTPTAHLPKYQGDSDGRPTCIGVLPTIYQLDPGNSKSQFLSHIMEMRNSHHTQIQMK